MAGAAERVAHRAGAPDQEVGVAAHVAGDQDRLADRAVGGGHVGMAGGKRAGCPLAMDEAPHPRAALELVRLELGDVVRDVVDQRQPERLGAPAERGLERAAHAVGDALAVRPREVGGGPHRVHVVARLG